MKIPGEVRNSDLEYCIDEYVRLYEHREILKEKWFHGLTIEELAEKHHISETSVKNVLYDVGDSVLIRASELSRESGREQTI